MKSLVLKRICLLLLCAVIVFSSCSVNVNSSVSLGETEADATSDTSTSITTEITLGTTTNQTSTRATTTPFGSEQAPNITQPIQTTVAVNEDAVNQYKNKPIALINQGGYHITTNAETIETSRFIVNIPTDTYVPDNLASDIDKLMNLVEKQTELFFYPNASSSECGKVTITVLPKNGGVQEFSSASGSVLGAEISPGDLLIAEGNIFALTHELIHCIHLRNGIYIGQTLTEGFATYNTCKVLESAPYVSQFSSYFNYSFMDTLINESSVNALFETDLGWDSYNLGFRFLHYLEEVVGNGTFIKILNDCSQSHNSDGNIPLCEVIKATKKVVSDSVYSDFAKWYKKNEKRFDLVNYKIDLMGNTHYTLYPYFGALNYYEKLPFSYNEPVTIDFVKGFEYLQKYKKKNANGIFADIVATGKAVFKFYDIKDTLLYTVELNAASEYVEGWGATKVVVEGDGMFVNIIPDSDAMVVD